MIGRLRLDHMYVTHRGMLFQMIKEMLKKPGPKRGNQTIGHHLTVVPCRNSPCVPLAAHSQLQLKNIKKGGFQKYLTIRHEPHSSSVTMALPPENSCRNY